MRLLALFMFLMAPSSYSLAATSDRYQVHGFSMDGKIFVMEVFGESDAILGGHSTYYFVDVQKNSFLKGTPIRHVAGEGANEDLRTIRKKGRQAADDKLRAIGGLLPGEVMASQTRMQGNNLPTALSFKTPYFYSYPASGKRTNIIEMGTFDAQAMGNNFFSEQCQGYMLIANDVQIHRDKAKIPKSRGCPIDYFLREVVMNRQTNDMVAIIEYLTTGTEGKDRNFLIQPAGKAFDQ